ncbi:MAG TPA: response regulator [Candidatus Saccharimonadales bacterium]|nr:response regulator [Candidatus Saccharimonadales bacterium]
MKILLVEPDKVLANTYARALKLEGHDVTSVSNAQLAIHAVDQNSPELIVLELQLSKHSGIEFLYELRSYAEWQSIPVILHTLVPATSLQNGQNILHTLGANIYLYKPQTSLVQLLMTVGAFNIQTANT